MSEQKRGCGFRKIGGLYLAGEGIGVSCKILPYNLHVCPTCGNGVKFSRGWSWIDSAYFAHALIECSENDCKVKEIGCPFITSIRDKNKLGLMWVGEKFYSPESFIAEANEMGISKRIHTIPKDFKVGETWVLLAHKKAGSVPCDICGQLGTVESEEQLFDAVCPTCEGNGKISVPAIFYAFCPKRIEKILTEELATKEELEQCSKRGITPVIVEDDPKHYGSVHDKQTELKEEE